MVSRRCVQALFVIALLAGCGDQRSPDGSDGAAVAACRNALGQIANTERLATTVREEAPGFLIRAWSGGRAEGQPDHLCRVTRDEDAERGVRIVEIQSSEGSGAYRSRLDIDFDN